MTQKLERALEQQKQSTQQEIPPMDGTLGILLDGSRRVEVPNRNGFVYVKLRNSPSEVIQAFNNQVAPSFNLPVLVERRGNKYVVTGVDTERYENNWGSFAPYLPRHGNTHSFDIESGGGGDIVWVYPRQFMPLLIFPSGSAGSPNVIVSPYTLKNDNGTWRYVGNTGTQSFANYRPTSATGAVMGLVYLSTTDGNPYILVNSGTVFSNSITGSSQIIPYIPSITNPSTQIPLAAIRLITGTNQISWDNIYDVRQFLHNTPTGTGGGGSASIDTGTLNSLYLRLDASNDPVTGGLVISTSSSEPADQSLEIINRNTNKGGLFVNSASGSWGESIWARNNYVGYYSQTIAGGIDLSEPVLLIDRFVGDSSLGNRILRPVILIDDIAGGVDYLGGTIQHKFSGTVIFEANPQATGTAVPYIFDTQYPKPTGNVLQSWRVQGAEKAYVNVSGTFHSNGQPLVKEAPTDGQSYARKNAGWEIVSGATGSSGFPAGYGFGCVISNNATDPTNDIDVTAGSWRDSTNTVDIVLASGLTKRVDAAWAVGTNQGGLFTGTVTNTTYHMFVIKRPDTGVVDFGFDTSVVAANRPVSYAYYRRVASLKRVSGAWQLFSQFNDEFKLKTPVSDFTDFSLGAAATDFTLSSIPGGINVNAMITCVCWKSGTSSRVHLWPKTLTDQTATFYNSQLFDISAGLGSSWTGMIETNTTPAIRAIAFAASTNFSILVRGWVDYRDKIVT